VLEIFFIGASCFPEDICSYMTLFKKFFNLFSCPYEEV
jgi:hypothetical protein